MVDVSFGLSGERVALLSALELDTCNCSLNRKNESGKNVCFGERMWMEQLNLLPLATTSPNATRAHDLHVTLC